MARGQPKRTRGQCTPFSVDAPAPAEVSHPRAHPLPTFRGYPYPALCKDLYAGPLNMEVVSVVPSPLRIENVAGPLRMENVPGRLRMENVSGPLCVESVVPGPLSMESVVPGR